MNQRIIKFRAWDKDKKQWIHDFRIHPQGMVFPAKAILDEPDGRFWLYERGHGVELNCELNLTFGLKDKKGRNVYFGDIIKYSFTDKENPENNEVDVIAEVIETINGGMGQLSDGVISDLWEDEELWDIEVIGNIYENKELLNDE
jgi:uncharacterized phage protein (TIGR01671 family)